MLTKELPQSILEGVAKKFGVDWHKVAWQELTKPFYSGLAAYLYVVHTELLGRYPVPPELFLQADLWNRHFDQNKEQGKFIEKATILEKSNHSKVLALNLFEY